MMSGLNILALSVLTAVLVDPEKKKISLESVERDDFVPSLYIFHLEKGFK